MFNTSVCTYLGDIGYLSKLIEARCIQFRHTPADYNYSWHTAPQRQFIVNLDGEVEVEVTSGDRRVIGKGEVFFVEDTKGSTNYLFRFSILFIP